MFLRLQHQEFQNSFPDMFPELAAKHQGENNPCLVKNFTFQVTEACSLNCTYCYQIAKTKKRMSFETAKKIVDRLYNDDNGKSEAIILEFIGGEPLLEIELIDKIIDYFMLQGVLRNHRWATYFMVSICSNGVAYFEPKVQEFIKKHYKHLSFSISIDGYKELHDACRVFKDGSGSYDIAVAGAMHYMNNYSQHMGTKMTFAPENIMYVSEALKNLILLGYTQINANCIFEKGWTVEHATIFYQELKKAAQWIIDNDKEEIYISLFEENMFGPMSIEDNPNSCGGNGKMLAVNPDGIFYPCLRYMETSLGNNQPPITCGDISQGIDWNKLECMECVTRRSQSTDECFYCPIATGCNWCSAYNYQEFGTINKRATYICEMHKARALANVYFWNKLYRKHNMPERFEMHCPKDWALKIIDEDEYNMLLELTKK
jgi:radical SAM peptide maturase (CXXX-repeat target family)